MAAFDWNGDGKIDLYDDMLELHNARQSMKNTKQDYSYNDKDRKTSEYTGSCEFFGVTIAASFMLALLATLWLATKVDMKSPVVAVIVFVIAAVAALFVCGFVQAVIEDKTQK